MKRMGSPISYRLMRFQTYIKIRKDTGVIAGSLVKAEVVTCLVLNGYTTVRYKINEKSF